MGRKVIFLPGLGADPGFWRPVGDRLPAAWAKTYLGWPGLGEQPASPAISTFADLVALVQAAIAEGPADLVAQSMGGAVALRAALDRPNAVRRIVLTGASGGIDVASLGGADWRPDYIQSYPRAQLSMIDDWPDLTAALPAVDQPVLLLWGDADTISPLTVAERLRQLLPHANLTVIPGGDHDFPHDRPAETAAAIHAHLG